MERHTILNSWKEIAVYMRRAVRTVQRWEKENGLPVHRLQGKKRSPVFALQKEIDIWLENCPQGRDNINQDLTNQILTGQHKIADSMDPSAKRRRLYALQQAVSSHRNLHQDGRM
jgi:hypothetical protein